MLLENKVAVIYGAAGAVGGAAARAFAREGATVYLAGRTRATLERLAGEIGGQARALPVDALDREAIETHLDTILNQQGRLDVSFSCVGLNDSQGAPLQDSTLERFLAPIDTAMRTQFLTATAAARRMSAQGSGVILAITAEVARLPQANINGFSVACAAIEGFCRQLAVDVGPQGVRVVCLRSAGSPDSPALRYVSRLHGERRGVSADAFLDWLASRTLLKRLPKLAEIGNAAALLASDYAGSMTAAVANVNCGVVAD